MGICPQETPNPVSQIAEAVLRLTEIVFRDVRKKHHASVHQVYSVL